MGGLPCDTAYVLGVDVGGTKIRPGFVDEKGNILASQKYPMDRSTMHTTLDSIRRAVEDFLSGWPQACPKAVGMGLVGRCVPSSGEWVHAVNLPIDHPVPIARQMEQLVGAPVYVDNDVYCATAAELAFGAGLRYRDFLLVNVGTGLSVGIVSDGRLLRGAGNVAGEAGQCFWSASLTLEQCCSGGGIAQRAQSEPWCGAAFAGAPPNTVSAAQVFAAAQTGNADAARLIENAVHSLCRATADLVAILNPSAVLFSGSVATAAGVIPAVDRYVRAHAYKSSLMDLQKIALSELDPTCVGLMGAARRAWEGLEYATGKDAVYACAEK